jgi:hypothetical protein
VSEEDRASGDHENMRMHNSTLHPLLLKRGAGAIRFPVFGIPSGVTIQPPQAAGHSNERFPRGTIGFEF